MLNTSGPGGLSSNSGGGSVAASEGSASSEAEEEQGDSGPTDAPHKQSPDTGAKADTSKVTMVESSGNSLSCASRNSSPTPPVTKATLSELDVPRIVFNPKLRHDVNFDPDLHFRPNLDGDSGRRKSQKATDFWNCLQSQLKAFMEDQVAFETEFAGREWCLQSTLRAIADILATLVPPEDRSVVEEILNVELLMQQFTKGVADLERLALWLSRTLKSHCAPMRDEWVDQMVNQLSIGNRTRDVSMLVQGLRTLLGVLEAMKLDVANHQIRCLRPLLIQDTVEFEQTFFLKKISLRKIDIGAAHAWFRAVKSLSGKPPTLSSGLQGDMLVFFKGFANFLFPSKMDEKMPETFMFDEERIIKLRSDILDAINLHICVRLLQSLQTKARILDVTPSTSWPSSASPSRSSSPATCHSTMTSPTLPPLPVFEEEVKDNHLELAKQAISDLPVLASESNVEDKESDMESSSSRTSSFSSTTSKPPIFPLSQPVEGSSLPVEDTLRQSILAIIDDVPGNNRWQQSCPAIALQLLRSTPSLTNLSSFESRLRLHLSNPTSTVFKASESHVLSEFYPLLSDLAARYSLLTSTQLFEVATSPRPLLCQPKVPRNALGEVAKQMAHIGVLHWRVWAILAYLVDPDEVEMSGQNDTSHTGDATERESRKSGEASSVETANSRRRSPGSRQNSLSKSIPAGR